MSFGPLPFASGVRLIGHGDGVVIAGSSNSSAWSVAEDVVFESIEFASGWCVGAPQHWAYCRTEGPVTSSATMLNCSFTDQIMISARAQSWRWRTLISSKKSTKKKVEAAYTATATLRQFVAPWSRAPCSSAAQRHVGELQHSQL